MIWQRAALLTERVPESEPIPGTDEAAEYDAMVCRHYWIMNGPFVQLLSRFKFKQAQVLDMGTGPGWIPIALVQRQPQWKICGLDASQGMVDQARRNAAAAG